MLNIGRIKISFSFVETGVGVKLNSQPNILRKTKLVAAAAPMTTRGPLLATKSTAWSFASLMFFSTRITVSAVSRITCESRSRPASLLLQVSDL